LRPLWRREEGHFGDQSCPAADKTGVSDNGKCVMGDPVDPVERGEIELALRTDYVEVINKARQAARDQHETPWPIGWPKAPTQPRPDAVLH
jgi:hypothetical protein